MTSGGDVPGWLIVLGVLSMVAVLTAGALWAVKARTGYLNSPLRGLPVNVRERVVHALHDQQPLADEEERRAAFAEAHRVRRLTPLIVTLMTLMSVLTAWGVGLRLVDEDRDLLMAGVNAVLVLCFASNAVVQVRTHRRAGAYLDRFAAPHRQS